MFHTSSSICGGIGSGQSLEKFLSWEVHYCVAEQMPGNHERSQVKTALTYSYAQYDRLFEMLMQP